MSKSEGKEKAEVVDERGLHGEFSDEDEDDRSLPADAEQGLKKGLLNEESGEVKDAAKDRRALCWSIAAMAMSIPALIGA